MNDDLMNTEEAAAYLGYALSYFRHSRALAGKRIGGMAHPKYKRTIHGCIYQKDVLDDWLKEREKLLTETLRYRQ